MLKDLDLPSCYSCSNVTDYSLSATLYVVLAKKNNKMYKKPHKTVEVQLNSARKFNYYECYSYITFYGVKENKLNILIAYVHVLPECLNLDYSKVRLVVG